MPWNIRYIFPRKVYDKEAMIEMNSPSMIYNCDPLTVTYGTWYDRLKFVFKNTSYVRIYVIIKKPQEVNSEKQGEKENYNILIMNFQ